MCVREKHTCICASLCGCVFLQVDIAQLPELCDLAQLIRTRARAAISKMKEFEDSFSSYHYLWTGDRSEFMRQFLLYGHALTAEELELYADYELTKNPPKLDNFKEQVRIVNNYNCFNL